MRKVGDADGIDAQGLSAILKAKAGFNFGVDIAGSLVESLGMDYVRDDDVDEDMEVEEPSGPFEGEAG